MASLGQNELKKPIFVSLLNSSDGKNILGYLVNTMPADALVT